MRIASYQFPILKFMKTFAATLLVAMLCITTAMSQSANHQPNIAPDEFTAKGASHWDIGTTVPNLQFNDIFNKKFVLYSKLDKVTVIELFDLKCQQCSKNKKYLNSFYKQYPINIISISTDQYINELREYTKKYGVTWANIMDDSQKFGAASFAQANFTQAPKFVVLTPDKKVHAILYNEKEIGKLGVMLQQYFAGQ